MLVCVTEALVQLLNVALRWGRNLPPFFKMFYTYIHFCKDSGLPFYIGKGKGNRLFTKTKRNTHWKNIANKHGFKAEICSQWNTEKEALEHEKFLIACFKDIGIPLANMTDGGEGTSGWIPNEEWRNKKSQSQKINFVNPMLNEKSRIKSANSRLGKAHSEQHKINIGKGSLGNKSRTGLKNSIESNLQRSITMKAIWEAKKSTEEKNHEHH